MMACSSVSRQDADQQAQGRDTQRGAECHQQGCAGQAQVIHFQNELTENDQDRELGKDQQEDRQIVPQHNMDSARVGGQQALQGARLALSDNDLRRGQQPGDGKLQHHAR